MIWIVLTVVLIFLIGVGMPLIRDMQYERRRREQAESEARAADPHHLR